MKLPDFFGGPRDAREVLGHYKRAGVTDPDAIYALKLELLRPASDLMRGAKHSVLFCLGFSALLVVSVIGMVVIPFVLLLMVPAPFLYMKGKRLAGYVEEGTRLYCQSLGIAPV
jgi:hypothetical protein